MPPPKGKRFVRSRSDYNWMILFFILIWQAGERYFKARSSPTDQLQMQAAFNLLGWENPSGPAAYITFFLLTGTSLAGLTALLWALMTTLRPATPTTHLTSQLKTIGVNLFVVLPAYQCAWEGLVNGGYTKVTMGRLGVLEVLQDVTLWVLVFELAWYMQHRAMHDNKLLWRWGHEYHHQWKRPEHMIGITNFAFDAVVEGWVTMSSSMVPTLFFPINWYVRSVVGLAYMLLAVLVHWDAFPLRYHINHHYLVTKNYGSHVPVFDMLFGTYEGPYLDAAVWDDKWDPARAKKATVE